jgi:hypothetical protein
MTRLQGLVKRAEDEVADLDALTTGLAESAAQWVKEWTTQRTMLSMSLDANHRTMLAQAAQMTAAAMNRELDAIDELREKFQDAVRAAEAAAKALVEEGTT